MPTLVAVTKSGTDEELIALAKAGARELGENRPGEVLRRGELLRASGFTDIRMHEIGTLQRNKVKLVAPTAAMIHSVDSLKLANDINRHALALGRVIPVLIEVNSAREEAKGGVMPEEAEALCLEISQFENIKLRGFMTMAPRCEKKEDYIKYFSQTYAKSLDIWTKKLHNISRPIISMGMSDSYGEAIECGADIVRIGRSLFIK